MTTNIELFKRKYSELLSSVVEARHEAATAEMTKEDDVLKVNREILEHSPMLYPLISQSTKVEISDDDREIVITVKALSENNDCSIFIRRLEVIASECGYRVDGSDQEGDIVTIKIKAI